MKPFVDRIASYILEHQLSFEHLTIVVPSERMIEYVQQALYKVDEKPKLSPKMITIDRWVQHMSDLPIIEKTASLFEMYRIFEKNPVEDNLAGFDGFLPWGQILLNDFDEIERYLVNPEQLFKNLRDVREIEQWSFNSEELSAGQQRFMAFWEKLGPYYHAFQKRLTDLRETTKGKIYRQLAENIHLAFQKDENAVYLFAGFNALSAAELSFFKQLHRMGRAHILSDNDAFYLNDNFHEAGHFQRILRNTLEVDALPFVLNELANKSCNVQLIECAQTTGQANVIGSQLADLSPQELNETLVLLANEKLMGSLLQHLPASIEKANITLGLPLNSTALKLWVDLIFRLQEAFQRRENSSIYYKDYIQYVHHPFITAILTKKELQEVRKVETRIVDKNWHFIDQKELNMSPKLEKINALLFEPWKNNWKRALENIQELNTLLDEAMTTKHLLEKSVIRTFSQSLVGLSNLLTGDEPFMTLSTFKILFNQHWSTVNLAYFGNPIDGLQIMGLLETRGLDFKRIFVLGLNEGTMPPNNPIQTLIPMDLRRYFGLPTPREKQGLFAHHFYRLLHSAENITITYSSASEDVGSTEPSRFIQQLQLELATTNPAFKMETAFYTLGVKEQLDPVSIPKTAEIIARLDNLLQTGLTYSKLKTFLECPLNFYYRYVLRIGEENKVEDEIESSTLGTIIHEVLELLYRPYVLSETESGMSKMVTVDTLKKMKDATPIYVDEAFAKHFSDNTELLQTGVNHISYVIANEIVQKVLSKELATLEENPDKRLLIKALELNLETHLELEINGIQKAIRLEGIVDRLDEFGGKVRVIDYKSGKVEEKNVSAKAASGINNDGTQSARGSKSIPEKVINPITKGEKTHTLQLMIYSYLYKKSTGKNLDESGIYSFRTINNNPYLLHIESLEEEKEPADFVEEILVEILERLFDETIPFAHNHHSKYCTYCE